MAQALYALNRNAFFVTAHCKKWFFLAIVLRDSECYTYDNERLSMKNILLLLLASCVHACVAMDEPFSVVIDAKVTPHKLRDVAIEAANRQQLSKAAVYAALNKIFTRMDTACIRGDVSHRYQETIDNFRLSPDFKRQTGPVYHPFDLDELQDVIQNPVFPKVFASQVGAVGQALVAQQLPDPDWVLDYNIVHLSLIDQQSLPYSSTKRFLVPKEQWFAQRAAVINEYCQDATLFPAGLPAPIRTLPRTTRRTEDCVLQ